MRTSSSHPVRSWRALRLAAPLLMAVSLGCSEPAPHTITRAFQSAEATFIQIDDRGRWAQSLEFPVRVSETVTLPDGAQLVLPWTLLRDVPRGGPVEVRVTISALQGNRPRILLQRNQVVASQKDWFEEHLDLSEERPGTLSLEIRFEQVEQGKRDPKLLNSRVALSPVLLWSKTESASATRPDIILIAIDTLRADGLSPYGAQRPTPTIEALANDGTLFEQAFSTASWTLPSFSSVFTGTFPWTHQATDKTRSIPTSLETLGEVFAANGYRTAGFHSGGWVRPIFGFNRGFDEYTQSIGMRRFKRRVQSRIEAMGNAPLLLFLHTYDVHDPYTSNLYTDPDYEDVKQLRGRHISSQKVSGPVPDLSDEDIRFLRDMYDGDIRRVDDALPAVFATLDEARPGRPRIVILLADHGESFGEQGRLVHESGPVAELAHVPLIITGTGIPSGRRVSEVVQTVDLMPTLIEHLGLETSSLPQFEGRSLAHHLGSEPAAPDPRAVTFSSAKNLDVLRTDSWSLIRNGRQTFLYDRRSDPAEAIDVSTEHPEQVERLLKVLDAKIAAGGKPEVQEIVIDEETHQDLKALGYLD